MNKIEFLKLLQFPLDWTTLEMYPDELFNIQLKEYVPGHEKSSEHTRLGAFHWWLHRNPDEAVLANLLLLASLDPDNFAALDIVKYIVKAPKFNQELENRATELGFNLRG